MSKSGSAYEVKSSPEKSKTWASSSATPKKTGKTATASATAASDKVDGRAADPSCALTMAGKHDADAVPKNAMIQHCRG